MNSLIPLTKWTKKTAFWLIAFLTTSVIGWQGNKVSAVEEKFIDTSSEKMISMCVNIRGQEDGVYESKREYYCHDKIVTIIELDNNKNKEDTACGIKIEITGANAIDANNYIGITSKEVEITKEGTSYIRAWAIDNNGNILEEAKEIIIHIDNTKPENKDIKLEITQGTSPLLNEWYNSEEVEVTITNNTEMQQEAKVMYGTRPKGSREIPENLKELKNRQEKIIIRDEGITEIVSYVESYSGVKSELKTLDVKIDRTPPKLGKLTYTQLEDNKVKMELEEAVDGTNGAGINKYLFSTNNGENEEIVSSTPTPETTINGVKRQSLVSVIAVDNAGNYALTSTPYAEAEYPSLYSYSVYPCNYTGMPSQVPIDKEVNAYLTLRNYSCLANLYQTATLNTTCCFVCIRWRKRLLM